MSSESQLLHLTEQDGAVLAKAYELRNIDLLDVDRVKSSPHYDPQLGLFHHPNGIISRQQKYDFAYLVNVGLMERHPKVQFLVRITERGIEAAEGIAAAEQFLLEQQQNRATERDMQEALLSLGWDGATADSLKAVIEDYQRRYAEHKDASEFAVQLSYKAGLYPRNSDTPMPLRDFLETTVRHYRREAVGEAVRDTEIRLQRQYAEALLGIRTTVEMLTRTNTWSHADKNTVLRGLTTIINLALHKLAVEHGPSTAKLLYCPDEVPF